MRMFDTLEQDAVRAQANQKTARDGSRCVATVRSVQTVNSRRISRESWTRCAQSSNDLYLTSSYIETKPLDVSHIEVPRVVAFLVTRRV